MPKSSNRYVENSPLAVGDEPSRSIGRRTARCLTTVLYITASYQANQKMRYRSNLARALLTISRHFTIQEGMRIARPGSIVSLGWREKSEVTHGANQPVLSSEIAWSTRARHLQQGFGVGAFFPTVRGPDIRTHAVETSFNKVMAGKI